MSDNDSRYKDDDRTEVEKDIEDVADKVRAGGKAVAEKLLDSDRDLEDEYVKEKEREKERKISSTSNEQILMTPREIVDRYAPQYMKLLIPHDGSESSDRVLAHAIYLSKISNAEIVILNVVEDIHEIAPTTIAASKESVIKNNMDDVGTFESELDTFGSAEKASGTKVSIQDQNIGITIEGKLEEMMKERINICKDAGVKSKVSYLIQTGKASERIVSIADERDIDLIIMASGSLGSTIKGIMSNTRKVIDSTKVPVLIINE
ncbi:MAG TPA: universal stress protein [Nitrososphaeraceae archaeon]|nr:universal stress protein [Nitrososphaeraceae archaeon]